MNDIGKRIKELRKKNDLTQEALADFLGVTYKAVSKWECGMTVPDIGLIIPLAKILQVSADELLGGTSYEIDKRRAEFDEHCDNHLKYDPDENYQMALKAVSEYPKDYKYLAWLASREWSVAHLPKYKEDPSLPYSSKMIDQSIRHSNMVIENCEDSAIREKAIWNALICCQHIKQYDEALKYAEMFPASKPLTRDRALEHCFEGERLIEHRQKRAKNELVQFCYALSKIYWFAERKEPYVIAALDTEEAVLKCVFPDGNYLGFHAILCCAYEKRAELEIVEGDYDKAAEYLKTMMYHAEQLVGDNLNYTCDVFDHLTAEQSLNHYLPYILSGIDDISKPIPELMKNRILKLDLYAPVREREDVKALIG